VEVDHHPHNPLIGLPCPEPHTCSTEALGKARWARRGFTCHPQHGLASIHSFALSYCLQPGGARI